jgi:hypothetical protein
VTFPLTQYKKPNIADGKRGPSIVRFGPLLFDQMFNRLVALDNRRGKRSKHLTLEVDETKTEQPPSRRLLISCP